MNAQKHGKETTPKEQKEIKNLEETDAI